VRPPAAITVRVPAKVNLQLSVGPAGPDGYHDLVTVFHAVSLYDEITATAAPDGAGISLTVEGEGAGELPADDRNLAVVAARLLADTLSRRSSTSPGVHLHLRKAIPVAGGMAGGSADAAAALVACDALWQLGMPRSQLHTMAAALGSDVPFALHGGTAVGTGRGDRLTPALARGDFHWVFALAAGGLSTPAVYDEHDRLCDNRPAAGPEVSEELMHALRSGDAEALGRSLRNDLQPAALSLRPSLRQALEVGMDYGALGGVVSGSGPTCAFLVRDDAAALDLAVTLSAAGVCRTVKRAHGPVPGARIIDGGHTAVPH